MIADRVRMDAYEEALRRVITTSTVVLDIGAGPGIMSLLAAKLGARRVIAVEPNPLVRIGARLAVENGFADRILFVQGRSQELELGEKVDVVVSDLRGILPNNSLNIDAIVDARRRLLKKDGVLIPLSDTIFVAPIQANAAYEKLLKPWRDPRFGIRMRGGLESALHHGIQALEDIDQLLGTGVPVARMDYRSVESPSIRADLDVLIDRPGVLHGLAIWFDTELVTGVGFSTAPDGDRTVYGRAFLPLPSCVEVGLGTRLRAEIRAELDESTMIWIWRGEIEGNNGSSRGSFAMSSVFSNPECPGVLNAGNQDVRPALTKDGVLVREILNRINGLSSVGEIAAELSGSDPKRFPHEMDAIVFVRRILERYADTVFRIEN